MRSVLVTGCSSGIGRCIADHLKKQGYHVFATARKRSDLDVLQATGFEAVMLDLADPDSIHAAVAQVMEKTQGRLYGLVNNAGYGINLAIEDLSRDVLRAQFETNVFGTHELTRLILPVMRKFNEGRIIQISSILGFLTLKLRGSYSASKHALESLSDALRYELIDTDIKVSIIEPGPIYSKFSEHEAENRRKLIESFDSSHYMDKYQERENQAQRRNYKSLFKASPEAVVEKVLHALNSSQPKSRYYVTLPTYLFVFLKRVLPASLLDKILIRM